MKTLLFGLLLVGAASGQTYKDYADHFIIEEGCRNTVYVDTLGHKTIGIGHKVSHYESFNTPLTEKQIHQIFIRDLDKAKEGAHRQIKTFDRQPKEIKIILVSMVFNLGERGFSKFTRFRQKIDTKDYKCAAKELRNSLYYKQLPNRVKRYIKVLEKQS